MDIHLPVDPSIPTLLGVYDHLHALSGSDIIGGMTILLRDNGDVFENSLSLDIGDSEQPTESNSPTALWQFDLVLKFEMPSTAEVAAGPNRGKIIEASWDWMMYFGEVLIIVSKYLSSQSITGVFVQRTLPVNSSIIESDMEGSSAYEYRIPIIAKYDGLDR